MSEDIIIPCASIAFFIVLFSFIALMRFLSYRETLALAEKGLVRGGRIRGDGKDTLRWGIVIAAIGMALCIGLYPIGLVSSGSSWPLGFGPWMLAGLLPFFFGLALVLIYVLTRENKKDENGNGNGYGYSNSHGNNPGHGRDNNPRPEPPPAAGE